MDTAEIIRNMLDKVASGDPVSAQDDFEAVISDKLNQALELKRQEVASSIYGSEGSEEVTDDEQETETTEEQIEDEHEDQASE